MLRVVKPDVIAAAGSLHLCAGQEAGIEAATHAMNQMFMSEETEVVLLVDATNAFNSVNRLALLHNVQVVCPGLATIAANLYRQATPLFVGNSTVLSAEGTTQGDPLAMPLYALAISPLVSYLTGASSAKNIWYADDSGAAGDLQALLEWWQVLVHEGPQFGYFPNSVKTWLVVKPQHLEEATQAFHRTGVQLTTEVRPNLGIPLGTDTFKEHFTEQKFATWKAELTVLSDAARHQPHAAFAAFTHGVRHKWSY